MRWRPLSLVAAVAVAWISSSCSSGGSSASVFAPSSSTPRTTGGSTTGGSTASGSTTGSTTGGRTTPGSSVPTRTAPASTVTVSENVAIPYTLSDPQSRPTSVTVEYSSSGTWAACTQGPGGDPVTNLATSPSGTSHTFVWDSLKDLGPVLVQGVVVRVTPAGQAPAAGPAFTVDNRPSSSTSSPATPSVLPTSKVVAYRGPYLQGTTRSSVTIKWRTMTASDTVVQYGPAYSQSAGDPSASETDHTVTISSLAANTTYDYRVVANGALVAGSESTFSTAPDSSTKTFTAMVFGDSGTGSSYQKDLASFMAKESFDLSLHLGDVIYPDGAEKDYDAKFFAPYQPFIKKRPLFPAMGNHDLMTNAGQAYFDAFHINANNPSSDERYYSFEWADAKFVSIETYDLFSKPGPHMTWLENELASNTRRWLVVMMHVPLYSVGFHGDNKALQQLLQPVFEKYKVDLVLQGHDHDYERTNPIKGYSTDPNWQGVPYIVSGGGGAQWYPILSTHAQTAYAEATYHFTLLTFTDDAIRGRVVRSDGTVAENFTITHQ